MNGDRNGEMTGPKSVLLPRHWTHENFKQRITTGDWKRLLLANEDRIVFDGNPRQLVARKLGYGVVEVYKLSLNEQEGAKQ